MDTQMENYREPDVIAIPNFVEIFLHIVIKIKLEEFSIYFIIHII